MYRRPRIVVSLLLIAFLVLTAGCQMAPSRPPGVALTDPLNLMLDAETTVSAAMQTLVDAADANLIERTSDTYQDAAFTLLQASEAMDIAWVAFRGGDWASANSQRELALHLHGIVRPLLATLLTEMAKE